MTRRDRAILAATLLLTAGLPLVDLVVTGWTTAVRYGAADAFYYDTVARNIATLGRVSFDQTFPTNGFHPLWQMVEAALYFVSAHLHLGDRGYLVASLLVSIALASGAVFCASRAFLDAKGHLSAWFLSVPIGAYALLMTPYWLVCVHRGYADNSIEGAPPLFGTLFSFMNRMESPLSLCIFAVLAMRYAHAGARRPLVDGLLLAALTLSRLDLVFVSLALLVGTEWTGKRAALERAAAMALPIAAYLVINRAYAGTFVPVSGATKSSFPHGGVQNIESLDAMLHDFAGSVGAFFRVWRLGQMLIPALFALATFPLLFRRRRVDALDRFLAASSIGVVVLALYNFFFVADWAQGHWYYAVSIFWCSLVTVALLDRTTLPGSIAAAVIALATIAIFFGLHRRLEYHAEQARLFDQLGPLRRRYPEPPRLLELDDGIISFATGFPCMNAMGLAVDAEAARRVRAGESMGVIAYERGYDRVAVFSYNRMDFSRADSNALAELAQHSFIALPPNLQLVVEYVLEGSRLAILRIVLNPAP